MRLLGIDLGDKRTGIALADTVTAIATPIDLLEVPIARRDGADLLAAIMRACERELGPATTPGEIVLGLPLNMDGSEGPRAKLVRAFGARLAAATGRAVRLHDERLTSAEADGRMARSGLTHGQKNSRRDAIAAAGILAGYLASRAE
jgi:putative Holliday junction resolvase